MNNVSCRVSAWCTGPLSRTRTRLQLRHKHNGIGVNHQRCISSSNSPVTAEDGSDPSITLEVVDQERGFARSVRARQHGNRSLPLPAFMDPIKLGQVEKRRQRKAAPRETPGGSMAALEKELAVNPYAHALATPIRQCSLSLARLPRHFLLQFGVAWTDQPPRAAGEALPPVGQLVYAEHNPDSTGSGSYALAHQSVVRHLDSRKNWMVLIRDRMKEDVAQKSQRSMRIAKKVGTVLSWDKQTSNVVLQDLRDAVRAELRNCARDIKRDGPEGDGGLLVKLDTKDPTVDVRERFICIMHSGGQDCVSVAAENTPYYRLDRLLGQEAMVDIKGELGISDLETVGVVKHMQAVALALALYRLHSFVGEQGGEHAEL